jgi:hypothetical protein
MVRGVLIHKIDRSARNLKDWADLGELIDHGIEVHFVNETLDMQSRGGRLSADIQAVIASDYIRNLREETKKGLYGRLKQGFYPLRAPIGYLDNGAAKPKTIDPLKGPLIQKLFELYASGEWTLFTLKDELYRRGLRNHTGGKVTRTGLHTILRNRFYTGVIYIRASRQTFEGNHEALVSKRLFEQVQDVLHGRAGKGPKNHNFLFRKWIRCAQCGYVLTGELQKGHVYYRCHTRTCPGSIVTETSVDATVLQMLKVLEFSDSERKQLDIRMAELNADWIRERGRDVQAITLAIEQISQRLSRATDAYLDGALDRDMFEERKAALIQERRALIDKRASYEANKTSVAAELKKIFELAGDACSLYKSAPVDKKREVLGLVTSNCIVASKKVDISWQIPFRQIAEREKDDDGAPSKDRLRTFNRWFDQLVEFLIQRPEIDFA